MLGDDDGRWVRQAESFFALAQRQHHQGRPAADGLSGARALAAAVVPPLPLPLLNDRLGASLRCALWGRSSLGDPVL